jgi:hypothetical protein
MHAQHCSVPCSCRATLLYPRKQQCLAVLKPGQPGRWLTQWQAIELHAHADGGPGLRAVVVLDQLVQRHHAAGDCLALGPQHQQQPAPHAAATTRTLIMPLPSDGFHAGQGVMYTEDAMSSNGTVLGS